MTSRSLCLGLLTCSALAGGLFAESPSATAPAATSDWQLVWADEFNQDGAPNPADWVFEEGFERNRELQWYQAENARCENGLLIIEARRESRPNPRFQAGSKDWRFQRENIEYTSASVTTRGKHAWLYGKFEVRARIDARPGLWPAIWTLGVDGMWPANGEVDLMEFYREMILANLFWPSAKAWKPTGSVVKKPLSELGGADWAKQFHVWRMEWDHEEIRIYVDELLLNRTVLTEEMRRDPKAPHPFRQPHYVLLNLALGSSGGDPSKTEFPSRFEVDYVRIYQRR